jgi:hypothetical protein
VPAALLDPSITVFDTDLRFTLVAGHETQGAARDDTRAGHDKEVLVIARRDLLGRWRKSWKSWGFLRVSDGTRTRGHRDHNPELYQLSYAHQARAVESSVGRTLRLGDRTLAGSIPDRARHSGGRPRG